MIKQMMWIAVATFLATWLVGGAWIYYRNSDVAEWHILDRP